MEYFRSLSITAFAIHLCKPFSGVSISDIKNDIDRFSKGDITKSSDSTSLECDDEGIKLKSYYEQKLLSPEDSPLNNAMERPIPSGGCPDRHVIFTSMRMPLVRERVCTKAIDELPRSVALSCILAFDNLEGLREYLSKEPSEEQFLSDHHVLIYAAGNLCIRICEYIASNFSRLRNQTVDVQIERTTYALSPLAAAVAPKTGNDLNKIDTIIHTLIGHGVDTKAPVIKKWMGGYYNSLEERSRPINLFTFDRSGRIKDIFFEMKESGALPRGDGYRQGRGGAQRESRGRGYHHGGRGSGNSHRGSRGGRGRGSHRAGRGRGTNPTT